MVKPGFLPYVPVLKWRQGEYLALDRLSDDIKDKISPIIEIPPIEWDFELGRLAKTIDQHLEKFGKRLHTKWGHRLAYIDGALVQPSIMRDGSHPLEYAVLAARKLGAMPLPVTGPTRSPDYQAAVARIVKLSPNGACFRVTPNDLVKGGAQSSLEALAKDLGTTPAQIDLLLDVGSPQFEPVTDFADAILSHLEQLILAKWRSLGVAGTSFPESMGSLKTGVQFVHRHEWPFYKALFRNWTLDGQPPKFGDYGIAHPSLPMGDMRLLKPSATIRYTVDDGWIVVKGQNIRDHGAGQYKAMCDAIQKSKFFFGNAFSRADAYINACGRGAESTGTLTTWRWIGTNHHITKVVDDLAKFGAI